LNVIGKQKAVRKNLVGGSTSDELVTNRTLVLGAWLILNAVTINVAQQTSQEEAYLIVSLGIFVITIEPTHDAEASIREWVIESETLPCRGEIRAGLYILRITPSLLEIPGYWSGRCS
jgi:hypothetical protein